MYRLGDYVVYGIHGICKITNIEENTIDRKKIQYYVLKPIDQSNSQFFVPIHSQAAVAKMHPMLSKEELDLLLRSPEVRQIHWISDENQRKQHYRDLITSGDRTALLRMVHALHQHKKEQTAMGRKFHLCDENFLRDAEHLLAGEFSVVLGIEPKQVGAYILSVWNE